MLRGILPAILLTLAVALPASAESWAVEMFQATDHDFGSVARDAKTEFEFVITNIFVEDVHIASVRSSCGCTSPKITKQTLKTHEKGAILAKLNTDTFLGRKGATLTVTIDKPFYTQVQLHVRGFIHGDVLLQPGSVELGSVDEGTAVEKTITVSHIGNSNWEILEVKSANPHISAKVEELSRSGGRVSYRLAVQLDEKAPVGYLKDHLMLVTNDHNVAEVPVPVEGRVVPGITVSPASLFMGVVKPGEKVTKQLVVKGKKPFRILSISCDNGQFEFDTTAEQQPKLVHLIPVTFTAGEEPGKVARTIRIVTDSSDTSPPLAAFAIVSK